MNIQLTQKEAYLAMLAYLENLHQLTKSDDLAGFLGWMQFMSDGSTIDPASWKDWTKAVEEVVNARDK